MMRVWLLAALLGFGTVAPACAEESPRAVKADSRIRLVPFQVDNVVVVYGTLGVSTMIMFADDERIDTVAIGDSLAWQAVPDQSKRFLFIKPLEKDAVTNMNVVTNKRVYNFIMRAVTGAVVFKIRFTYPDEEANARLMAQARAMAASPNLKAAAFSPDANYDYSYKGHDTVKPANVFDVAGKTYFRFSGDVPGVFLVNADRTETLVNYRREGDFLIVDKVAGQWTMRSGGDTACVFNMRAVQESAPKKVDTPIQPDLRPAAVAVPAAPAIVTKY